MTAPLNVLLANLLGFMVVANSQLKCKNKNKKPLSQIHVTQRLSIERREGDSNPRSGYPDTTFPMLHNRPLCHLSGDLFSSNENDETSNPHRMKSMKSQIRIESMKPEI